MLITRKACNILISGIFLKYGRKKQKKDSFDKKYAIVGICFLLYIWGVSSKYKREVNLMSEENQMSKETTITEIGDKIRVKVAHLQESEGSEIELSEMDLDEVAGGAYEISACVTYKTKSA
jgi:hypothetical protein